jgi:glycerol uptake facilitator-like aquaporin
MATESLLRKCVAEALGTTLLLATVVGSGIMAERLSQGNSAMALLATTIATGAALVALIVTFDPISGAHFNPTVTLAFASQKIIKWRDAPAYIFAQVFGALAGVAVAHLMFGEPLFFISHHAREGYAKLFSEFIATFGLLSVIWSCVKQRSQYTSFAVAAYITAAHWFTSSSSFANPVVTMARIASNTYAGIRPVDVPGFVIAQLLGAVAATFVFRWLVPSKSNIAAPEVMPHVPKKTNSKAAGQRIVD